jgi:capsular polysaccharide biosynthesis protein
MPASDILRILRRRGWIVILLALLTAGAAYGFSRTQRTLYRSTVEVLIQPARTDFGVAQTAKLLLGNYTALIYAEPYAQRVIDKLQLDMEAPALKGMATVSPDIDRLVIAFEVRRPDPGEANRIAQAWADELVFWRNAENQELRKEDRIDAVIREEPKAELYQPQTRVNVAAGALLGLLLGGALVFALEWIDSGMVRTPAEVERLAGLTVLAAIPRASAARRRQPRAGQSPVGRPA